MHSTRKSPGEWLYQHLFAQCQNDIERAEVIKKIRNTTGGDNTIVDANAKCDYEVRQYSACIKRINECNKILYPQGLPLSDKRELEHLQDLENIAKQVQNLLAPVAAEISKKIAQSQANDSLAAVIEATVTQHQVERILNINRRT